MPYSLSNLPPAVRDLSPAKQKQWLAVFNAAYAERREDAYAFAAAWASVTKEQCMPTDVRKAVPICTASDHCLVYGVVLEPDMEDSQGDIISADDIEKAAHDYLRASRVVGDSHIQQAHAEVVESFIAPGDIVLGEQQIRKGSWVMVVKIHDTELWESVKAGEITGFSIGGTGNRTALIAD